MKRNKNAVFKLLFFTDTHYSGKSPVGRIDNLFETSIAKTLEVFEIAKEENVDDIIHLGDMFDKYEVSNGVAATIGRLYIDSGYNVKVLPGNHDIMGNNINTLGRTKLGLMDSYKAITVFGKEKKLNYEAEGITIEIVGSPADFGVNGNKDKFILDEKNADISIQCCHAMIVKDAVDFADYVPLLEIQEETKADITYSGDFHLGFDTIEHNGKIFVNPGAMVRKSRLQEEIDRMPQVSILEIYDDKSFSERKIVLKTAKPGKEVLDRTKIEESEAYTEKLFEFKQNFQNSKENAEFGFKESVIASAKKNKMNDKTVEYALLCLDTSEAEIYGRDQ